MSIPLSAWAIQAADELHTLKPIAQMKSDDLCLDIRLGRQSLWVVYHWPANMKTVFRAVFSPTAVLKLTNLAQKDREIKVNLDSLEATYELKLAIPKENWILSYTTSMVPKQELVIPFWPKDILNFSTSWQLLTTGQIHAHQVGSRSGILFYSLGKPTNGSVLYFQNLGSFNPYFEATQTSGSDLVGGQWPEIGFSLPCSSSKSLNTGITYVISDAIISFSTAIAKNDRELCQSYLSQLASVYPYIKRPQPIYHHWLETVESGLSGLSSHSGCWTFADGHHYLNAYVSDYATPPEIMVQLAVLLPLLNIWIGKVKQHTRLLTD